MIKNVFFDFGQVLIKFIPYDMTKAYVQNEDDIKLIEEVVFDRLYWDKLDEDKITDEQVIADVYRRLPERLHKQAHKVYFNWIYNIPQIEGMEEIVVELKNKGVNICLLSKIKKWCKSAIFEVQNDYTFCGHLCYNKTKNLERNGHSRYYFKSEEENGVFKIRFVYRLL